VQDEEVQCNSGLTELANSLTNTLGMHCTAPQNGRALSENNIKNNQLQSMTSNYLLQIFLIFSSDLIPDTSYAKAK
jgi:hypothetical protein